mmetsp:Transcript_8154/g.15361  ORF Transcript_8154/g.15361 Transcript_8154/m.15361 type:complete len:117 (+) Transcript_8154:117-467(+)
MPRQVRNDNDSMGTQSPPQSSASPFSLHSLESSMLFSRSVRRLDRMARDLYMREQTLQVSPALIVLQCGAPHERFRLARHLQVQGLSECECKRSEVRFMRFNAMIARMLTNHPSAR